MSESDSDKPKERRLAPPFPSRHELHSAAIPQVQQQTEPPAEPRVTPPPVRREPPKRPRTTFVPTSAGAEEPLERVETPAPEEKVAQEDQKVAPALPESKSVIPDAATEGTPFLPVKSQIDNDFPFPKRVSPVTGAQPVMEGAVAPVREQVRRVDTDLRRKRRRRRRLWMTIIALVVLVAIGAGGYWAWNSLKPTGASLSKSDDFPAVDWEAQSAEHPTVEVTVEPGELGSDIGNSLVEAGVVKSLSSFTRAFDANPAAASIKPGTYTLPTQIPAVDALAALLDETNRSENSITINPGQTVAQIAEKMVSVVGFPEDEVTAVVEDPAGVEALPKQAGGNLEGWLWPGSYEFSPTDSPADVFNRMVTPTVDYLKEQGVPKADWEETLIRASIVEREVNRVEDMPKVARVIENRISDPEGPTRGMLQMDSTVTYGVGGTGGLPNSAAFADDNPYNTYIVKGLPAGPIASPSTDAIDAVLKPAEGDWLYFVTVNLNTGETVFTNSHEELGELTDQLIAWCEENPDECKR